MEKTEDFEIKILKIKVEDILKKFIEQKNDIDTNIFNSIKDTISHFTNFDTPDRYVLEDVNIDKKIVVFDFSHLYDIESEYHIEMNTLIKKLFNSLSKYFNFYFCIKLFRYEPNFEHLSCDRYWILRQMAESAIIKTIFKEKKRED